VECHWYVLFTVVRKQNLTCGFLKPSTSNDHDHRTLFGSILAVFHEIGSNTLPKYTVQYSSTTGKWKYIFKVWTLNHSYKSKFVPQVFDSERYVKFSSRCSCLGRPNFMNSTNDIWWMWNLLHNIIEVFINWKK
jgi:hypothetical protein